MANLDLLKLVVEAHPALLLDDEERATVAAELPDLAAIEREHADDTEALVYCVWAYRKLGRFDEALAAADRALAIERSYAPLTAKATVYRAMGDVDRALPLFAEAAQLDPDDNDALKEAARTLGEAQRFAEAAEWFSRCLERDDCDLEAELWRDYSLFCVSADPQLVERMKARADEGYKLAKQLFATMTAVG